MKYLLVMALVLVVFWIWRHNRDTERRDAAPVSPPAPQKPGTAITEIVACEVCGVHLPKTEALIGNKGIYCSDAHRRQARD
jgi:uncharacterized protein